MSVMKVFRGAVLKCCTGDNYFLRNKILREYHEGNPAKAIAMMFLSWPIHNAIKIDKPVMTFSFTVSSDYYSELHNLLHIAEVEGFDFVRIGRDNDGGYILLNDFQEGGTAYSFGISSDVSWDKDMALRGYDVFMYDHTIDSLPEDNSRFHWFKQGISDGTDTDDRLTTLEELIRRNHHEDKRNMILKMDVEKAEWGFLENVSAETLTKFRQIVLEFHGLNEPEYTAQILSALRKLNRTHQLVHIHGQNHGYYVSWGGHVFCNQIEATYVLRDAYTLNNNIDVSLPITIDMPAHADIPEVRLGSWNTNFHADDTTASVSVVLVGI